MKLSQKSILIFKSLLNNLSNHYTATKTNIVKAFLMIEKLPNGIKLLNKQGFMTKKQILDESNSMNTAIIPPVVKKIKSGWFYSYTSVPITPNDTRIVDVKIIKELLNNH